MRKRNKGRKFGREKDQRKALLSSLCRNLFVHGKIKTTEAKAKELRMVAEKMITRAKTNTIFSRRILSGRLSGEVVKKLIEEIAPKYIDRKGGYTRIMKLGQRRGDAASMVIIELV